MKTLYDDNFRIFDHEPAWRSAYESSLIGFTIYAETAFGAVYCSDTAGVMHLLDPEDRELTDTGCNEAQLLALIGGDTAYYIDQDFYKQCCDAYGKPALDQHFSYRHPIALGGRQEIGNVIVMDAAEHMRFLGSISSQIAGTPEGTSFHPAAS